MMYQCERCLGEFSRKDYLKAHLLRKTPCESIGSTKDASVLLTELTSKHNSKTFACEFCHVEFAFASGRSRHKKTCKANPDNKKQVTVSEDTIVSLQARIAQLEVMSQASIVNTNCNNITVNNTQNITVNVNNFGQEDMDYLLKRLEYYWHNKAYGIIEMTKDIHFDPQHPENHTFTISNQRARIARVRENGEWISKPCEEVFDDIMNTVARELDQFIADKHDYLKEKFPRIVDKTNEWWDKVGTDQFDEKEYRNIVKRLTEMVILNRHTVDKT
jgi:hypothetical protein